MGMAPHLKCCGCCCSLQMGTAIATALYLVFLLFTGILSPVIWPSENVEQAKMFCAGTTAAYRKGDDINSALIPSITPHRRSLLPCCTRRSAHPAPDPAPLPDAQATTSATAPTSAPTTGTRCRRVPTRLACTVGSLTYCPSCS